MIRENKLKYLISSIVIVLPFLVSLLIEGSINEMMKGAWYFSWIMPLILWGVHTGLLILTRYIDPIKQDKKIENIIFFIVPSISFYTGAIFIALMLGFDLNIGMVCAVLMGVMFIIMGNYMPKAKRNNTFGIKLRWTVTNDDNWIATHRLAGKVSVIVGIITLLTAFLPTMVMFVLLAVNIIAIAIIPTVYSYNFYKQQIASGEATEDDYSYDASKRKFNTKVIVIISVAMTVLICILMTVGSIKFEFGEESLRVKPSMGGGIELKYSELSERKTPIYYVEEKVPGTRVMGYGSTKLLYGQFKNDEFGMYTRYTYTKSTHAIIIHTDDGFIVLSGKTNAETWYIYQELVTRVNASN